MQKRLRLPCPDQQKDKPGKYRMVKEFKRIWVEKTLHIFWIKDRINLLKKSAHSFTQ